MRTKKIKTEPRRKVEAFQFAVLCKICQNSERTYLSLLKWLLGWSNKRIEGFVNSEFNCGLKLNQANTSLHFSKHESSELFWANHKELLPLKEI